MSEPGIENLLHEDRLFPPSPVFSAQANGTADLYDRGAMDFERYWMDQALARVSWFKEPTEGLGRLESTILHVVP